MGEKIRLDAAVTARGLAQSREKAKALIMAGSVFCGNERMEKPGGLVEADAPLELRGVGLRYVSRGGFKLEKALALFNLDLTGKTCMDIGASTGGFTDCMLQNGAEKVYAVDVGYGQLAWSLRTDPRVVSLERTNVRHLSPERVSPLDFASVDVSFISLTLVLPVARELLREGGEALCLVKPQFEAGKGKVGKKGVVRELSIHREVCQKIYDFLPGLGFRLAGATFSPIKGPQGNIEYLYYLKTDGEPSLPFAEVETMLLNSHEALD